MSESRLRFFLSVGGAGKTEELKEERESAKESERGAIVKEEVIY